MIYPCVFYLLRTPLIFLFIELDRASCSFDLIVNVECGIVNYTQKVIMRLTCLCFPWSLIWSFESGMYSDLSML